MTERPRRARRCQLSVPGSSEKMLSKAAGLDLSPPQALQALKTVRVVDIALGPEQTKRGVTRGSGRCASILKALEITDLEPPEPPRGKEEIA